METIADARELARLMVSIGTLSGRSVVALISDMNQPLGNAVGNALEVKEAIQTLHGEGPEDFAEHCMVVAEHMLVLGKKASSLEEARQMVEGALKSGRGWEKFRSLIKNQGGDVDTVDHPERLPQARIIETVTAPQSGIIHQIHAREVGETSVDIGGGRAKKSDAIDHAVGIVFHHKVGDRVSKGDPLFTLHINDAGKQASARERLLNAYRVSAEPCAPLPLFYDVIQ